MKFAGKSLQREVWLLPHYTGSALAPLIKREERGVYSMLWDGKGAGRDAGMGRGADGGDEGCFVPHMCLGAERVFGSCTCLFDIKPGSSPLVRWGTGCPNSPRGAGVSAGKDAGA